MPNITILPTNNCYKNLAELYKKYSVARDVIVLEGTLYLYQASSLEGEVSKHYYRCEEELHNLVIHRICGKVYLVDGIYPIKPLNIGGTNL